MNDKQPSRFGLRGRLLLVSLGLVFFPLLVVWSVGVYETIERNQTEDKVRKAGQGLHRALPLRGLSAQQFPTRRAWLAQYAREHRVMVRILDASGQLLHHTSPRFGERLSLRGWVRRAANFFYGPTGPPDLLAFEQGLPPTNKRPEVRAALAGQVGERWRQPPDGSMDVYYRALPMGDGRGIFYLTRLSRRSIRALYDVRYQLLKLTLILAAAAAAMGLWIGWRVVRPLVRLQRRIHGQMKNPAAIDPQTLALPRGDEIGALAHDFQELVRTMKQQLDHTAEVAADLAHDLKNPIATISASAEMLAGDGPLADSRRQRLARATQDAASHMQRTVDGMLDLARLEQELATAKYGPLDFDTLVAPLCQGYQEGASHRQLEVCREGAKGIHIHGVREQLERLLRNLLDNAMVFARSRVRLTVERDTEEGQAVIAIADDGPGISEGNREKLFRRFFTVRPEGAKKGTGLGLSIARTIAVAHGGTLELAPANEGEGARFVLRLPLHAPQDKPAATAHAATEMPQ